MSQTVTQTVTLTVTQTGPTDTEGLRRHNTASVLRRLRQGPATRAGIAKSTGLAKATVGTIVADLEARGAARDQPAAPGEGTRGRPGRPVSLVTGAHVGIGLEINVDYVGAVVLDLAGRPTTTHTVSVPPAASPREALLDLTRQVRREVDAAGSRVVGATVAVPGLVRSDHRTVAWAPNLASDVAGLAEELDGALRVPVAVSNDANCAAYAEARHGAATGVDHAVYVTGTVGIGVGIVQRGELLVGEDGFAGEIGHLPIGAPDARCGCGRLGCWEASVGLHAMLDLVGMDELATPVETARAVAARAADRPAVARALTRLGHDLGLGLVVLAGLLDPAVVVLGGYFVPLGELVLAPARAALDERLAAPEQRRPEVRLSTLGIAAAATGAAERSLAAVLAGEVDLEM